MSNHDDDLVTRALAFTDPEDTAGAERRKARLQATLAAMEADPAERARINRIAAAAGITDQDEGTVTPGRVTADALVLPETMMPETRRGQEQLRQLQQDTLDLQDKLIAQGEKMRAAMAQIEEHAAAAEQMEHGPRSRGTTLSQITMPVIVVALIGAALAMATRPGGVAGVVAVVFAALVGVYSVAFITAFLMSAWRAMQGNGHAEKVLRLLMGSLSVEERLAEARARAITRALRNTPPDDTLDLMVGADDNPDIIRLTRRAASGRLAREAPSARTPARGARRSQATRR
jgi:hypothetical protein